MTTHATAAIKGLLGEKLGMTQVWDENNRIVPVTVVKAGPNVVTQVRTQDTDGYDAVQLAFGATNVRKVTNLSRVTSPRPALRLDATSPSCAPLTRRSTRSVRSSPPTSLRQASRSMSPGHRRARVSPAP